MQEFLIRNTIFGAEQAVANYIIRNRLLPIDALIESNVADGSVFTCGLQYAGMDGNDIFNFSRGVPTTVHQYDRHNDLIQLVNRLYRSPQLLPIDGFNDINSILDFVNAVIYHGGLSLALGLMLQTLDKHPDPKDWRGAFSHLQKIMKTTLSIPPQIFNAVILEQSVCCAFTRVFSVSPVTPDHFDNMFSFLMTEKYQRRTIYKPFEQFLRGFMWQSVKNFIHNNEPQQAAVFIERLESLNQADALSMKDFAALLKQ